MSQTTATVKTLGITFHGQQHPLLLSCDSDISPDVMVQCTESIAILNTMDGATHTTLSGISRRSPGHVLSASVSSYLTGDAQENSPLSVVLKWAKHAKDIRDLHHEYNMYENCLKALQGSIVPLCYGIYQGVFNGTEIHCLVLEALSEQRPRDPLELNYQRMLIATKLHAVAICNPALLEDHHYVAGSDEKLRIVDFSSAYIHVCRGAHPMLYNRMNGQPPRGCMELEQLEAIYGISSSCPPLVNQVQAQTVETPTCCTQ
ncbi:hypothetical protein ABKN59_008507 [Abortiporus biennis]